MNLPKRLALCLTLCAAGTASAGDGACDWRVMTDAETRTAQGWGAAVARAVPALPAGEWCDYGQTAGAYEMKMDYSSLGSDCKKALPRAGKAVCEATAAGCFPKYKTEVMYRKYKPGAGAAGGKDCGQAGRMSAARESETWQIDTMEEQVAFNEKMARLGPVAQRLEDALERSGTATVKMILSAAPTACKPAGAKLVEPSVIMHERVQNEGSEYANASQEWCFGANVVPRQEEGAPKALTAPLAPLQSVEVRISGAPDAVRELGKRLDRKAILAVVGRK